MEVSLDGLKPLVHGQDHCLGDGRDGHSIKGDLVGGHGCEEGAGVEGWGES